MTTVLIKLAKLGIEAASQTCKDSSKTTSSETKDDLKGKRAQVATKAFSDAVQAALEGETLPASRKDVLRESLKEAGSSAVDKGVEAFQEALFKGGVEAAAKAMVIAGLKAALEVLLKTGVTVAVKSSTQFLKKKGRQTALTEHAAHEGRDTGKDPQVDVILDEVLKEALEETTESFESDTKTTVQDAKLKIEAHFQSDPEPGSPPIKKDQENLDIDNKVILDEECTQDVFFKEVTSPSATSATATMDVSSSKTTLTSITSGLSSQTVKAASAISAGVEGARQGVLSVQRTFGMAKKRFESPTVVFKKSEDGDSDNELEIDSLSRLK